MALNVEQSEEELERESFRDRDVHQTEGVVRVLTRPTRGYDAPAQGRVRSVARCNERQADAFRLGAAYSSFTLTETDSGTDSNLDSKPDGYIVLCRIFHIAETWTRIPTTYFCVGQESRVLTRVCFWQCK